MKKNVVAIIGHFGGNTDFVDGQTIKTKILYDELSRNTNWVIQKVDTYYKRKNPLKLLCQTLYALIRTKHIIILLSGNGMQFYFPILSFFSRVCNTNVYHDVIGGNLDIIVERKPKFRDYLNSFCVNWVETERLKTRLEALGVTNTQVVPNFKRLQILEHSLLQSDFAEPYRFCTFSRVMREKGIEDAVQAVENINRDAGRIVCKLDIYGKVDTNYQTQFDDLMATATPAVTYCGVVPYDQSVEAIRDYYALLFPTYWRGEGFAGTIVDAFSAGLPVIATDWNCNAEIIEHKVNGVLYPNEEMKDLQDSIFWVIENQSSVKQMRLNCIQSAKQYQPDKFIEYMVGYIQTKSEI